MNQETIKWIREAMDSVRISIIGRYEEGTLKQKDQLTMNEMLGNIADAVMEEDSGNQMEKDLVAELYKLQNELCTQLDGNIGGVRRGAEAIDRRLDEMEKVNHISTALQLDVQSIMPLMEQIRQKQEEVRQSFQKAVDLDFKLYGEVSSLTNNALEAYHFEISADKQVVAAGEKNQEKTTEAAVEKQEEKHESQTEEEVQHPDAQKQNAEKNPEERMYIHIPYQDKESFAKITAFLKENGGRFDPDMHAWHIAPGKIPQEELDKRNIGEYLNKLPSQGRVQFQKTVEFLKENGARFDKSAGEHGMWYLPADSSSKETIKNYLKQIEGKKNSVLAKLDQNKERAERGGQPHMKEREETQR